MVALVARHLGWHRSPGIRDHPKKTGVAAVPPSTEGMVGPPSMSGGADPSMSRGAVPAVRRADQSASAGGTVIVQPRDDVRGSPQTVNSSRIPGFGKNGGTSPAVVDVDRDRVDVLLAAMLEAQ